MNAANLNDLKVYIKDMVVVTMQIFVEVYLLKKKIILLLLYYCVGAAQLYTHFCVYFNSLLI